MVDKDTAKTKTSPDVQYCIVEQFLDVPLKFGIRQYFKQLFPHSGTRKLFPSVWRCFSTDIIL